MTLELATTLTVTENDRLEQAQSLVRGYCRWHIAPSRTEELILDGSGGMVQPLPSLHVTEVDSVLSDDCAVIDFEWSAAGILVRPRGRRWSCRLRGVVVYLTHGYEDVPPDVTAIVQAIASRAVSNPGGVLRQQAGPFSASFSQTELNQSPPLSMLGTEESILDRYRIPALA